MKMFCGFEPSPGFTSNAMLMSYVPPVPDPTDYILGNYTDSLKFLIKGGTTTDISSNGATVFVSGNSPTVQVNDQQGNANGAYFFSGTYISVPTGSSTYKTLMFWGKCIDVVSDYKGILGIRGWGTTVGSVLEDSMSISDVDDYYQYYTNSNTFPIYSTSRKNPQQTLVNWHMYTLTIGSTFNIYLNNSGLASASTGIFKWGNVSGNCVIGALSNGYVINGSLLVGFVAQWDKELTSEQVIDIWNNTK